MALEKKILLIFSNCQGNYYKRILENFTNINDFVDIKYLISYENLNRFKECKSFFETCDILLINPIENHQDFLLENIKKYTKSSCVIIRLPFIRFNGFWLPEKYSLLKKFHSSIATNIPNISIFSVDDYLSGLGLDKDLVERHFNESIKKLQKIEDCCDIKFVEFFLQNYKRYALFKDEWHPTNYFYDYIAYEIIEIIKGYIPINNNFLVTYSNKKNFGHYSPINDKMKEIMGLEYDLDTYFIVSRKTYLSAILNYEENTDNSFVDNYNDFNKNVLKII